MVTFSMPSLENFDCDGAPSSVGLRWQKFTKGICLDCLNKKMGRNLKHFLSGFVTKQQNAFSTSLEEQLVNQIITEKCLSTDLRKKILANGDTGNLNTIIAEANSLETIERQMSEFNKSHWHRQVALSTLLLQGRIKDKTKNARCGLEEYGKQHQCKAENVIFHNCKNWS
nr:unnamed protein product [Callosobruchus chinensis]